MTTKLLEEYTAACDPAPPAEMEGLTMRTITLTGCGANEDSWDFAARAVLAHQLPRTPDSIDHDAPHVHCRFDDGAHCYVNSDTSGFDSDCAICGGKERDAIHHERPRIRQAENVDV